MSFMTRGLAWVNAQPNVFNDFLSATLTRKEEVQKRSETPVTTSLNTSPSYHRGFFTKYTTLELLCFFSLSQPISTMFELEQGWSRYDAKDIPHCGASVIRRYKIVAQVILAPFPSTPSCLRGGIRIVALHTTRLRRVTLGWYTS